MAIAMMRGQFADLRQPFAMVRAKITQNRQQIEERQPTHKHDEEDTDAMRGDGNLLHQCSECLQAIQRVRVQGHDT